MALVNTPDLAGDPDLEPVRIVAAAITIVAVEAAGLTPVSFSSRIGFSRAAAMSSLAWIALSMAAISRSLVEGT